jgi:hypothetical protein
VNNLIFAVTTADVLKALSHRTDVSALSPEEIESACQEVKAILEIELDIRPYIDMGLDVWEISRKL